MIDLFLIILLVEAILYRLRETFDEDFRSMYTLIMCGVLFGTIGGVIINAIM